MKNFKREFLAKLESRFQHLSFANASEHLQGASPPSIFVGRFNYPKVFVGPLIPEKFGDTRFLDAPEQWLPSGKTASDIIEYRLSLVRGKKAISIYDDSKQAEQMREIALSQVSPEVEATFAHKPVGVSMNDDSLAFGPSAPLKSLSIWSSKWDAKLEKMHSDTDATAKTAMLELYEKGSPVSAIMRALSVGAFGLEKNRKFVPTRWSITAVDSTISESLVEEIKLLPILDEYRVYEHESLRNRFVVILFPSQWQYEWIEAFFSHYGGDNATVFGDNEGFDKKKKYSSVGGCYYSARLAVAEKLQAEKRQAGALVLREAYSDYIPLGVFNVRENVRAALRTRPTVLESWAAASKFSFSRLKLNESQWTANSRIIRKEGKQAIQRRLFEKSINAGY
ncbi:MAG: hypothetical protein AB1626_00695 [Candidatus Micrarchaeota archaeon]